MNERGRVPLTFGGTETSCKALGRRRPVHKADDFVVPTAKKEHQSLLWHRTGKEVSCYLISARGIYVLKVFINSFFFLNHRLHTPDPIDLVREGSPSSPIINSKN